MNLLDDDDFLPWERDAYYQAARRRHIAVLGNAGLGVIEMRAGGQLLPHVLARYTLYCCIAGDGMSIIGEREAPVRWGDVLEVAPRTIRAFTAGLSSPLVLLTMQPLQGEEERAGIRELLLKLAGRLT